MNNEPDECGLTLGNGIPAETQAICRTVHRSFLRRHSLEEYPLYLQLVPLSDGTFHLAVRCGATPPCSGTDSIISAWELVRELETELEQDYKMNHPEDRSKQPNKG